MFKTSGTINKEFFDKIKFFVIPKSSQYITIFVSLLCLLMSVFKFYNKEYVTGVLYVAGCLLALFITYYEINKYIKTNFKRLKETTNKEEVDYTTFFEDDGVIVQENGIGATAKVAYDNLNRLVKSNSTYLIFTNTNMIIPIFIDCLNDEQRNELLNYLKTHAPQLKC